MATIKHLIRPLHGWYNSSSKKDRYFFEDVEIPPYVARKLIRKGRCIESNINRKVYVL